MDTLLTVTVLTPTKKIFQGQAQAVSSTNSKGKFDILPYHSNFITIIQKHSIVIKKADGADLELNFSQAIILNTDNKVSIFAEPLV